MSFSRQACDVVMDVIQRYTCATNVCPCTIFSTLLIHGHSVISMSPGFVRLSGHIAQSGWAVRENFKGCALKKPCDHVLQTQVEIRISMDQWEKVVRHVDRFIIVQGKVTQGPMPQVDASCNHSGILPDPTCRIAHASNERHAFELFSGGFSGWTQVCKGLSQQGHEMKIKAAVDIDHDSRLNYVESYDVQASVGPESFSYPGEVLPDSMFIEADIRHHGWLHLLGHCVLDTALLSPPCPAWSNANTAPGLNRRDGQLTAESLGLVSLIGPTCVGFEMVAGIKNHAHWELIKQMFDWMGYSIRWLTSLDLAEQLPQHRSRLLMIATRNGSELQPHFCVKWHVGSEPSLDSHEILMQIFDPWKSVIFPSRDVLRRYLQESLLPRDRTSIFPPMKKSRGEPLNKRIRFCHEAFDCIMASYSRGHELPEVNLTSFGLFGCLVMHNDDLRFLQIPEVLAIFGAVVPWNTCFDHRVSMQQLGNCISIPHAAIVICNILGFLDESLGSVDVQDLCEKVIQSRMHAGNLNFELTDRGFRFFHDDESVPATLPIHEFCILRIHDRDNQIDVQVERKVDIWSVLTLLFGDVSNWKVVVTCSRYSGVKIPVTKPFPVMCPLTNVEINMPATLLISDEVIRRTPMDTPCCLVLSGAGPVILHMGTLPNVSQALNVLSLHLDVQVGLPTDLLGSAIHDQLVAPFSFMELSREIGPCDITVLEMIQVQKKGSVIFFHGSPFAIRDLCRFLEDSQCRSFLERFGWHFTIPISNNDMTAPETLMLTRIPGSCAISCQDVLNALVTLVFLFQIRAMNRVGVAPWHKARFRLFDRWVWQGEFSLQQDVQFFHHAWERSCRIFSQDMPLRFIVKGRQIPVDMPIASLFDAAQFSDDELRIHTVLRLTGGGPIRLVPNDELPDSSRSVNADDITCDNDPRIDLFHMDSHHFEDAHQLAVEQWRRLPGQNNHMRTTDYLTMQCTVQDGMMIWNVSLETLLNFAKDVKSTGIEMMLDNMGWMFAIQWVAWEDPLVTRLIMFPRPEGRKVSLALARKFLCTALFRFAQPDDGSFDLKSRAMVRVHAAGQVVAQYAVHRSVLITEFTDSWEQAAHMVAMPSAIRILVNGKQASREFRLIDYAKVHDSGEVTANIHYVLPLRGGAPGVPATSSSARNMLATWMMTQGADVTEVSQFVQALSKAGSIAIASILSIKERTPKMNALKKLAMEMNITVPDFDIKQHALKNKIHDKIAQNAPIDLTQIRIKEGHFINDDDSHALQRPGPVAGESGVSLVLPSDAAAWLGNVVSTDEQLMLIVGTCPSTDKSCCKRIHVPAYCRNDPIVLDCCAHQIGQKHVKIKASEIKDVPTSNSCIFAITVFRDEISPAAWEAVMTSPVKNAIAILFQDSESPSLICPPWGRTFHGKNGKPYRNDPHSFQVHVRIPAAEAMKMLKVSGKRGVYSTPKTEDRKVASEYQVVWLNVENVQLSILAGSHPNSLGIVRNTRNMQKITKGIRFLRSDFQAAFQALRPNDELPKQIPCHCLFKISPVPAGATIGEIQQWLDANGWVARPIRSLSATTWLCGCEKAFDSDFGQWNDRVVLLKWIESKQPPNSGIVAGALKSLKVESKSSSSDGLPPLADDPWGSYLKNQQAKGGPTPSVTVPRKVEKPIEDKFQAQQAEVATLRDHTAKQFEEIRQGMQVMQANIDTQRDHVKNEFQAVRAETKQQFQNLNESFTQSLTTAMGKQDAALSAQMTEIKNLLLNRPNPQKKFKAQNPSRSEADEMEDGNL